MQCLIEQNPRNPTAHWTFVDRNPGLIYHICKKWAYCAQVGRQVEKENISSNHIFPQMSSCFFHGNSCNIEQSTMNQPWINHEWTMNEPWTIVRRLTLSNVGWPCPTPWKNLRRALRAPKMARCWLLGSLDLRKKKHVEKDVTSRNGLRGIEIVVSYVSSSDIEIPWNCNFDSFCNG
jgi:hypothetical protein